MVACLAWWRSGQGVGLASNRDVAGSSRGHSTLSNDLGQLVHTHVPLFTKQYKLVYRPKLGAKQALHATHWPRVRGVAASVGVWLRAT